MTTVAIVGCGTIGRGWTVAFAGAGYSVRLYDESPAQAQRCADAAHALIAQLPMYGSKPPGNISVSTSLSEAVAGADYVQECINENAELKKTMFEALCDVASLHAVLASSASALLPDTFLDVKRRDRCIVAHPFNPVYLLPAVELVPSRWTSADTISTTQSLLRGAGLVPVVVCKAIFGYIGNRLQAAVVNEAMALIGEGVTSPDELDALMIHALGPRWALSGPFETMDLNAPGGVEDYAGKYRGAYAALGADLTCEREWSTEALAKVIASRRAKVSLQQLGLRSERRDAALAALNNEIRRSGFHDE